ncbi:hypothetical protein [Aminobacter sp. SR38]|uniref:hypothetical protein n=1 Tax=Aminobacter sp. SR38 TaxID=2774562 RepID=UPI001FF0608E|nr:hypothetical protein [Aminobacter sp. SR38]
MSHTATPTLYTGFHQLVTGDVAGTVLNGVDILVRDGRLLALADLPELWPQLALARNRVLRW